MTIIHSLFIANDSAFSYVSKLKMNQNLWESACKMLIVPAGAMPLFCKFD